MKKIGLTLASVILAAVAAPAGATEIQEAAPAVVSVRAAGSAGAAQSLPPVTTQVDVVKHEQKRSNLTFMDSKLFDMRLGQELSQGRDEVVVKVTGHVSLSNIPSRIDNWVVRSAEQGKVELIASEEAPKTRFIMSLIPMVFNAIGAYKTYQEERMFDQVKAYDTKIYYKKNDSGDSVIDQIVLTKRMAK